MSQIFRRSHLPSWLGGNDGPAQAPRDPQVRKWIEREKHGKEALAAARQIEKALVRKPETLDLSAVPHRLLDGLTGSLMQRLSGPTRTLVLPQDCPVDIALRLMCVIGARHIEPKPMMAAVEEALSPRPCSKPRRLRPRTPPVPVAPAPASTDSSVYDVPPRLTGHEYAIPPRRTGHDYAVPPRRGDNDDVIPPGRSKDHDVLPRRDRGIYERPESLVVPKGPASLQPRDGKDPALDASPFEGAIYVEGPDEVEGSNYVFAEARRAPAGLADPVHVKHKADAMEMRRQGVPLDMATPRSSLGATIQQVCAAVDALRAPMAWLQARAGDEGQHPRCAISSSDAIAIARALVAVPPGHLRPAERQSMIEAKMVLVSRRPAAPLELAPETVRHLGIALDVVRRLVADEDPTPPPLPARNSATERLRSVRSTAQG